MGSEDFQCYCKPTKDGDWIRATANEKLVLNVMGSDEESKLDFNPYNRTVILLRYMHLICAVFQLLSNIDFTRRLNSNIFIIKKLLVFITVPLYIATILGSIFVFDISRAHPDATCEKPLCFSQQQGNSLSWVKVEITGFYVNIFVLIFYLARTRFVPAEDSVSKSA